MRKKPTTLPVRLGGVLSSARQKKGLSLQDVSRSTGLSVNTIVNYEMGKTCPSLEKLVSLASVLGADLHGLISSSL
jgi:transcriptional regulator with XRE-family HTH domain